ncbi:MAG: hypothetical protein ACRDTF_02925, partial [Pseudonocardiaceae bacterium]
SVGTGAEEVPADTDVVPPAAAKVAEPAATVEEEPATQVLEKPTAEVQEPAAEIAEEPAAEVLEEPAAERDVEPVVEVEESAVEVEEEPAALEEEPVAEVKEQPAAEDFQLAADPEAEQAVPQPTSDASSAPASRRRRGLNGTPVLVSELLPLSVLSTGRSGRRRAEDRVEGASAAEGTAPAEGTAAAESVLSAPSAVTAERGDAAPSDDAVSEPDDVVSEQAPPETPNPGPPLAPTPRALECGPNGTPAGESLQVGMGALLAEALAAFQEDHPPFIDGSAMTAPGGNAVDSTRSRGFVGRRVYGLQLARDPVVRNPSNVGEALTDPELRLPDLTAEPPWRPDGTGRQSAAGD